jgi:ribosomal protein L44E
MAKTTKKQTLMARCKTCGRVNPKSAIRLRKLEITA